MPTSLGLQIIGAQRAYVPDVLWLSIWLRTIKLKGGKNCVFQHGVWRGKGRGCTFIFMVGKNIIGGTEKRWIRIYSTQAQTNPVQFL